MSKGSATGICTFKGCPNKKRAKGLCSGHWNQQNRGQELQPLRTVTKPAKEKGSMIKGVEKARKVVGISEKLFREQIGKDRQGPYPPKKVKAGGRFGFAWAFDDDDHVHNWHAWHSNVEAFEKKKAKAKKAKAKKVKVPAEVPPFDLSRAVVGMRQAANVLGVTHNVLYSTLTRHIQPKFPHLVPKQTNFRSDGKQSNRFQAWYWEDEAACRAWWDEVRLTLGRVGKPAPPAPGGTSNEQANEEADMANLFSEETLQSLRGLQDRLNTKNLRAYRRARGEVARLPLREVLDLALGLGLSHWEEVLDEDEEEDNDWPDAGYDIDPADND